MEKSKIFRVIGGLLYPFLLVYGFHIVVNGDLSPGGGFQGGVIFATAFFIRYLLDKRDPFNLMRLARFEKVLFLAILVFVTISFVTKGEMFTNFITSGPLETRRLFLVALNFLIGLKVTSAIITIISSFVEEGDN